MSGFVDHFEDLAFNRFYKSVYFDQFEGLYSKVLEKYLMFISEYLYQCQCYGCIDTNILSKRVTFWNEHSQLSGHLLDNCQLVCDSFQFKH